MAHDKLVTEKKKSETAEKKKEIMHLFASPYLHLPCNTIYLLYNIVFQELSVCILQEYIPLVCKDPVPHSVHTRSYTDAFQRTLLALQACFFFCRSRNACGKVDLYLPEQKGSFRSWTLPRINGFYICLCHRLPQKVLHRSVFFQIYVQLPSTRKEWSACA